MKCIGEILSEDHFNDYGRIAVLENKQAVLNVFGLKHENWLKTWNIDPRVLTLFYQSHDEQFDWFIVVFDYKLFCSDLEMKKAIIWHEIGHIHHPVYESELNLESEIRCDQLAIKKGYGLGMKMVLDLTMKMARSLNHDLLASMTNTRLVRLRH